MNPSRKKESRHLASQETLDIEEAIQRLIQRLLENSIKEGQSPEEISEEFSSRLSGMVKTLSSASHPTDQGTVHSPMGKPAPFLALPGVLVVLSRAQRGSDFTQPVLTVDYLDRQLIPYLGAVSEIQGVIHDIKGTPHQPMVIHQVSQKQQLEIQLENAVEAFTALAATLPRWRETYRTLSSGQPAPDSGLDSQSPRQQLQSIKTKLAMELVERVDSSLSTSDKVTYSIRFQPALEALLVSEIEIQSVTE